MTVEKYIPSKSPCDARTALLNSFDSFTERAPTLEVLIKRIEGEYAEICDETFYVAHDDGRLLSRHWMGWGRHNDAIGNWGYFFTDPDFRGQGIGGSVLRLWHEDFLDRTDLPLCFLCTTGSERITEYYGRFGFRPAIEGRTFGPLYMPVGDSPSTFAEFCDSYYRPSDRLRIVPATMQFRHEADCLLRFFFTMHGMDYSIGDITSVDIALMRAPERTRMIFSDDGHCVGWGVDGELRIHPLYERSEIVEK